MTPWVGLCDCLCSDGPLQRRLGLFCVFACVLMVQCNDAMG